MSLWNIIKYTSIVYLFLLITGCTGNQNIKEIEVRNKTDVEIADLLIGNWFVSPVDTAFYDGNGISSYTRGHEVFYVGYTDPECTTPFIEAAGTWKVQDNKLIIQVKRSSNTQILPVGTKTVDRFLYIDHSTKVLKSINDTHRQIRTKTSTCPVEKL